jgi:hypothetical protein
MSFRFLIAASVFLRLAATGAVVWAHAYPAVSVPADGALRFTVAAGAK